MGARLMSWMKKWWVIALVFVLALSLTSCAPSSSANTQAGQSVCHGTFGDIIAQVIPRNGDPTRYDLYLAANSTVAPGTVTVAVAQQANPATYNKTLIAALILNAGQPTYAGTLTSQELGGYDILAIYTYQPGTTFATASPAQSDICTLPYPGDNLQ